MTPFQLRLSKARLWDGQSPLLPPDHRFLFSTQSRASEPTIEFPLLLKSQAFPRLLFSVDCPSRLSFQLRVRPRIELPLFSFSPNSSAVLLRVGWFRYFLFSLDLTLPLAHRWASPIDLRRGLRRALLWLPSRLLPPRSGGLMRPPQRPLLASFTLRKPLPRGRCRGA